MSYSFGPGPVTPAVKLLLIANIALFVLQQIVPVIVQYGGLTPGAVFERFWVWQIVTYMFLHGDIVHLLFNMLPLWMFGVELERLWGTERFTRYYFYTGIAAGVSSLLLAKLPFEFAAFFYYTTTVGASGAIYGLLLAYGLLFPYRTVLFLIFPMQARVFVIITGAIVLWSAVTDIGGGTAHIAHLGGMVFGYLYLTRGRGGPWTELKYRYTKWKMNRMRKRFDVHQGGRRTPPGGWTH